MLLILLCILCTNSHWYTHSAVWVCTSAVWVWLCLLYTYCVGHMGLSECERVVCCMWALEWNLCVVSQVWVSCFCVYECFCAFTRSSVGIFNCQRLYSSLNVVWPTCCVCNWTCGLWLTTGCLHPTGWRQEPFQHVGRMQ